MPARSVRTGFPIMQVQFSAYPAKPPAATTRQPGNASAPGAGTTAAGNPAGDVFAQAGAQASGSQANAGQPAVRFGMTGLEIPALAACCCCVAPLALPVLGGLGVKKAVGGVFNRGGGEE